MIAGLFRGIFLTGDPVCIPHTETGEERWTVVTPISYRDHSGYVWSTEPNFITDGASIPAPLRVLYGNPFRSDYIRPGALHDFYYREWAKKYGVWSPEARTARKEVDEMFYEAAIADGIPWYKAYQFYLGVRIGGWVAWNNHARREA